MLHSAKGMISQMKMGSLLYSLSRIQTKMCLTTCGMKGISMAMIDLIKTLWSKMFPPPTPDQELIKQLKDAVREVARLGAEAHDRGIFVYLKDNRYQGGVFIARSLIFRVAYRVNTATERFE